MLRDGPPRRSQWPRGGCKAPTRANEPPIHGVSGAYPTVVALARLVQCCDWTCEPWIAFDGELTAVTVAAAEAPVAWRLNGDSVVRRSFTSCNEQTLTITTRAAGSSSACRTSSNDGPDAIVHFGRLAAALGGGGGVAPGSRPRWRTLAAPPPLRGSGTVHTLRVYAFACPGSAHGEGVRFADTCVPGLGASSVPHTHGPRVPASRAPYAPEAQGSFCPGEGTTVRTLCAPRTRVWPPNCPSWPKLPTDEGSATAIVNRSCERIADGTEEGAARTTKRIAIAPCRSAGGWFHVAVNIAAA